MHGYYWSGGGWVGWMLVHWVFWLILIGLLIFGILKVTGWSRSSASSALDLLNERYARGEIDRDDYLQRKNDILER